MPGYDESATARWVAEPVKRAGRSDFERDRARVLHSAGLRRLAAKTQVVTAGSADFPRTRLTHSLECAQIGRELGREIGCDPDLVDAACLAHDIGHSPFGHNGEFALNELAASAGGFEGNAQSLRLLTRLEPKVAGAGLNLTRATLDATLKYPWFRAGPGGTTLPDPPAPGVIHSPRPPLGGTPSPDPFAPGGAHPRGPALPSSRTPLAEGRQLSPGGTHPPAPPMPSPRTPLARGRQLSPGGIHPSAPLSGIPPILGEHLPPQTPPASPDPPAKYGVYGEDAEVFTWIRAGAPTGRPCLEAQVMDWADDVAYSVHDLEDGLHAGLITLKNLNSSTERAVVSQTTADSYCDDDVAVAELTEVLDSLLALDIWPGSYDGGPETAAALKNLTSELIGRFCIAAQQATLRRSGRSAPLTRYAADLIVPRQQRLECALLKGITAHYVMARAGVVAAQARERELLAELAFAIERGAPRTLDPLLRPSWDAAGTDAARRRVVIDQVASLTDTSAIAWHHRLCALLKSALSRSM